MFSLKYLYLFYKFGSIFNSASAYMSVVNSVQYVPVRLHDIQIQHTFSCTNVYFTYLLWAAMKTIPIYRKNKNFNCGINAVAI